MISDSLSSVFLRYISPAHKPQMALSFSLSFISRMIATFQNPLQITLTIKDLATSLVSTK